MVQPSSGMMAAGSVSQYRSGQTDLGLETSFSSSGEGRSPNIVALMRDSSSTTDEGMSHLDDDSSDAQSLTSRGDSPETIGHEPDPRRVDGGGGEWSVASSVAAVTSALTSSDSTRHKRTLSDEDKTGQGQLLRKACDLCTKVRPTPPLTEKAHALRENNRRSRAVGHTHVWWCVAFGRAPRAKMSTK